MRLISKAAFECSVGEPRACCYAAACLLEAAHHLKPMGADPERPAKLPGQFPPAQVRNPLQLGHGRSFAVGREQRVAHRVQAGQSKTHL
jgi:hypothetical protein